MAGVVQRDELDARAKTRVEVAAGHVDRGDRGVAYAERHRAHGGKREHPAAEHGDHAAVGDGRDGLPGVPLDDRSDGPFDALGHALVRLPAVDHDDRGAFGPGLHVVRVPRADLVARQASKLAHIALDQTRLQFYADPEPGRNHLRRLARPA
ncbi:MAG: hypothetical protein Q8S13_05470 [Dehalococcoidia bacterium]|nr:hypothetical protein [Dehalococcoidia bacterium]